MSASKRRWFRFSLRTLLVAVTVFGCWIGYQINWIQERHKAKVGFGNLVENDGPVPCHAPWPLNWLGEEGHSLIMIPDFHSKEEIERIKALFPEALDSDIVAVPPDFDWPEGIH